MTKEGLAFSRLLSLEPADHSGATVPDLHRLPRFVATG